MNKFKYLLLLTGSTIITCAVAKTITMAGYATCKVDNTTTDSYICCSGQDWQRPSARWLITKPEDQQNGRNCAFYGSNIDPASSCQKTTIVHNDNEGTMQRPLNEICKSKSGKLKLTD